MLRPPNRNPDDPRTWEDIRKQYLSSEGDLVKPYYIRYLHNNPSRRRMLMQASEATGVSPEKLWVTAMQEGLIQNYKARDEAKSTLRDSIEEIKNTGYDNEQVEKDLIQRKRDSYQNTISELENIDGFSYLGLDDFSDNYQRLSEEGYLPEDYGEDRFEPIVRRNENGRQVNSARFSNLNDALTAVGAEIKSRGDSLSNDLEELDIENLSNEGRDFFTSVYYNAGVGNGREMLESYSNDNLLENDTYLQEQPTEYWNHPYKTASERFQNMRALRNTDSMFNPYSNIEAPTELAQLASNEIPEAKEPQAEQLQFTEDTNGNMYNYANVIRSPSFATPRKRKFGWGGALSGGAKMGAQGAALGSSIAPGIGTVIGGIGGAIAGGIFGSSKGDKQKKLQEQQIARQQLAGMDTTVGSNMAAASQGQRQFARGGAVLGGKRKSHPSHSRQMGNSQEAASSYHGPRHEKGGIDLSSRVEVEGGETRDKVGAQEYIFSDRLKVPDSGGKTFAEVHQAMVEKKGTIPEEKIQQLAQLQEKVSGRSEGSVMQMEAGPKKMKMSNGGPMPVDIFSGEEIQGMSDIVSDFEKDETSTFSKVAPYAGSLLQAGIGAFGPSTTRRAQVEEVNRSGLQNIRNMNTNYNINPQLNEARQAQRNLMGDPNASTNAKLASNAQRVRQVNRLQSQKENRENQLENQQQSALANAKNRMNIADTRSNNRANARYADAKMREDANREAMIMQGIQGAANTYQRQQFDKKQRKMQKLGLEAQLATARQEVIDRLRKRGLLKQFGL